MAIVVVGGLITSIFLSLLVIPIAFTYVDDAVLEINGWLHRRRQGRRNEARSWRVRLGRPGRKEVPPGQGMVRHRSHG